jgi:hypothetical protein
MTASTFSRPVHLCKQIVILDGLTGTGKTMFSPLVSSFERMQNARFEYMFEYLSISAATGKLTGDAASTLLNLLADTKYYDGVISREVNLRPGDLSSVLKSSKAKKYIRQLFMADGAAAGERIEKENPILFLVTHQLLSCMQPAIEAFGDRLRVIQMVRHPLYLLDHWLSYIDMHGTNPRDFTIWLDHPQAQLPWFAMGWEDQYVNATPFDRVIYSISELMKPVLKNAGSGELDHMMTFVPFEQFVLSPQPYVKKIEELVGATATAATQKVLRTQKVPRKFINAGPQKNIYKRYGLVKQEKTVTHEQDYQRLLQSAKERSSATAFTVLENLVSGYEENFGLWF